VVQNLCAAGNGQQWTLTPTTNGYYTITNRSTNQLMDAPSATAGASLDQTALSGSPTQSQQWLLRPAYFRGVDNALLEKQEAARIVTGLVWWKDTGGAQTDVLQILKNHGVNLVRVRPSSAPPYANPSQAGCTSNACFEETEAQDLDLAKRTKNLGMSLELTVLFDGGGSGSGNPPPAWAGHSLPQLQTDVHDYVKAEILRYRQNGTMPDLVSIGNEVNNGFLTGAGNVMGSNFSNFTDLQKAGMQGVADAAADTSLGPAIPAPLTCIHITPQWPMTDFFTRVNSASVPYDAICQSYYPIFHGPLFTTQSNAGGQPVEVTVLNAATSLNKPIFVIEAGELYENGSQASDPWYPPSQANQAQFLRDLDGVLKALPNDLGMGLAYWDPAGVDIPRAGGGLYNGGTNLPDAIYLWNGLTIFDNADTSGSVNVSAPNYSTPLPALDALGGK
jgi:arabinogalactan endo-1,4-beta-galactosidase